MVGVALERGCEDLDLVDDGKIIARREARDEVLQLPRGCDGADVKRRLKFPNLLHGNPCIGGGPQIMLLCTRQCGAKVFQLFLGSVC